MTATGERRARGVADASPAAKQINPTNGRRLRRSRGIWRAARGRQGHWPLRRGHRGRRGQRGRSAAGRVLLRRARSPADLCRPGALIITVARLPQPTGRRPSCAHAPPSWPGRPRYTAAAHSSELSFDRVRQPAAGGGAGSVDRGRHSSGDTPARATADRCSAPERPLPPAPEHGNIW